MGKASWFCCIWIIQTEKLRENSEIVISKSGLWISPEHPFLGASPDAAICDPTEKEPYGFVEIKCLYKHRNTSLPMTCEDANFCCRLTTVNGEEKIQIKRDTCIMHRCKDKWQLDVEHGVTLSCIYQMKYTSMDYTLMLTFGRMIYYLS